MACHSSVRTLFLCVTLCAVAAEGIAQETMPRELVVQDVRFFLRSLEEVHPDPYSALGGKIEFKRRAQAILWDVPESGLTARGIHDLLAPLIAGLGDGHTRLIAPESGDDEALYGVLPVRFGVVTDAIYVALAARGFEDLIGHRLTRVEERPVDEVRAAARSLLPAENEFGAGRALARTLMSQRLAGELLGQRPESLRVDLVSPDGIPSAERELPYAAADSWTWDLQPAGQFETEDPDQVGPIRWRLLEPSGTGYLRLRSIEGREAFEQARDRSDLPGYVGRYYERYLDAEAPAELDRALAGIPCFTETVVDLLTAMRDRGSDWLIVDVRGNGGGWSSLMKPLYLLAFGRTYAEYPFPDTWIDSASPAFLELNGWTAGQLADEWGAGYDVGDYRFETVGPPQGDRDWNEYSASLESLGCGLAARVRSLDGLPIHPVDVIVITDSGTFSAAFQLAYTLWRLGATVVGTPSAQAGNAFTNVLPIELPNSRIRGSVARSAQLFFPDDEALGRALMPDYPVRWRDLERFGFDRDAEVIYALELISSGSAYQRAPGGTDE